MKFQWRAIGAGLVVPVAHIRLAKERATMEIERRLQAPPWRKALYRAEEAWAELPAVPKWSGLMMTLVLAGLAIVPGGNASVQGSFTHGWEDVQQNILKRAAVSLTDDFRAGLADWDGNGDWARSWEYDQAGFVKTGPMALYRPSLDLTDYRMEFLGQIAKGSLGWAVRAADLNNYYAVKLAVVSAGPIPEIAIVRYPVVRGVAGAVQRKSLPIQVQNDTLYRVLTEVRGGDFTLTVQGQVVDSWSDAQLKRGGVGFFSGKGEQARLRWVGVWHQYDTLGRLCALLAPGHLADRQREE